MLAFRESTEQNHSMTQPTPPFRPADRETLRRRLLVDRPLHWDVARALFAALETAWDELERVQRRALAADDGEPRAVDERTSAKTD